MFFPCRYSDQLLKIQSLINAFCLVAGNFSCSSLPPEMSIHPNQETAGIMTYLMNICHMELFSSVQMYTNINDEAMAFETIWISSTSETSSPVKLVSLVEVASLRLQACFILFVLPFCLKLFQSTDSKVQSLTCNLEWVQQTHADNIMQHLFLKGKVSVIEDFGSGSDTYYS